MGETAVSYLTSQLTFQAPMLLVYFVGLILAAVFLGRAPTPAILTGVGVSILGLTTIAVAVVQAYLHENQNAGRMMSTVGLAGMWVRAFGLCFLLAAIFAGRNRDFRKRPAPRGTE